MKMRSDPEFPVQYVHGYGRERQNVGDVVRLYVLYACFEVNAVSISNERGDSLKIRNFIQRWWESQTFSLLHSKNSRFRAAADRERGARFRGSFHGSGKIPANP